MNRVSSSLEKLHDIAMDLSRPMTEHSLHEIFQGMSAKLLDICDVDHSTITLLDEGRHFFVVEAEFPQMSRSLLGEPIPILNRTSQNRLVNEQESLIVCDLNDHELITESPSFRQIVNALDIRSLLIVPMVTNGETIGTISLDTIGRTKCFSTEEVKLCQSIANQLAAFVSINRFLIEQRKYRRQTELLASIHRREVLSDHEERIVQTLFGELAKYISFKKASLQFIVEGKRSLVGAFGFDKSRAHPWLLRPVDTDPIIREIVQTQMPKIVPCTTDYSQWKKQEETADVNSWIGIPLVFQNKTIGILTLDHDQTGFYGDIPSETLKHLEELAVHAAHDLGDVHHLAVAQQQTQALEIIREFAEMVATKLDFEDVLLTAVSVMSKGLECARCSIFLVEQCLEDNALLCNAICKGSTDAITKGSLLLNIQPGQMPCPLWLSFQRGESILIDDRERDSRFDFTHEVYNEALSMIVVPLKIAKQVIGAVLAVYDRPACFSTADQLLLETLARLAASAMERDYGLELVHSIGNQILCATEVRSILEDVVSGAMKLTHTDSGVIYELNKDCSEVIQRYKPEESFHPNPRLDNPEGITRTVIASRQMLEIPDIEKDIRVNPELRGRYRSMFAVPLLWSQSVVGVLYLNCKIARSLTETERSLLDTLAGQAALAIQRTRLYEQIKESQDMYRSLIEQSPDGIVVHEYGKITLVNPAAVRLFGAKFDTELIGRSILDFVDEGSHSCAKSRLDTLGKDGYVEPMVEMCIRRMSGEKVEVEVYTRRVPGRGEIQAVFHDLTRPKTLLREMHHRVRRSLNQVSGFLTLQEQFTKNQEVSHVFNTLRDRIQATGLVHIILSRTGKESDVDMELYLKGLKEGILGAYGSSEQVTVKYSAGGVILNEKQATACGLVITELVSNSLLHAFPLRKFSTQIKKVSISLQMEEGLIRLIVSDNGIGIPKTPGGRYESMGLSLVHSLVTKDLKGTIRLESGSDSGTFFTIVFPYSTRGRTI